MQFVEHDPAQPAEQLPRLPVREQQRQLLRRGQQDVGRLLDLAGAFVGGRVAGAGLDPDGQAHLAHRRFEIARDVGGERLEGRDVEGVERGRFLAPAFRVAGGRLGQLHEARQEARQCLAGTGRRHQQDRSARSRLLEAVRAGAPAAASRGP